MYYVGALFVTRKSFHLDDGIIISLPKDYFFFKDEMPISKEALENLSDDDKTYHCVKAELADYLFAKDMV